MRAANTFLPANVPQGMPEEVPAPTRDLCDEYVGTPELADRVFDFVSGKVSPQEFCRHVLEGFDVFREATLEQARRTR